MKPPHSVCVSCAYLLRGFDGEGEVLEDEREVRGVAEGHVGQGEGPLAGPVGGRRLVGRQGLQRGL